MSVISHKGQIGILLIVWVLSLLLVIYSGDQGPDSVRITPEEKTLEVGDTFQFEAAALAKDKELSGRSFEWVVEGAAGTVDETGQFTAREPGGAVIIARTGDAAGEGKVVVQEKRVVEAAPDRKMEASSFEFDVSDLPVVVSLDEKGFERRRMKAVPFSHLNHYEQYGVDCTECHHDYQDGKNVWTPEEPVKKCVDCHDPNDTQGRVMNLMNAFHRNCRDCHKEMVDQGKPEERLPHKRCGDCHKD